MEESGALGNEGLRINNEELNEIRLVGGLMEEGGALGNEG
jgi:hypothetical protein